MEAARTRSPEGGGGADQRGRAHCWNLQSTQESSVVLRTPADQPLQHQPTARVDSMPQGHRENHHWGATAPSYLQSKHSFGGTSTLLSDFESCTRRVAIAGPDMHMVPSRSKRSAHGNTAPPLTHAQRLSFNRAIRRAAVDVTHVNHISNVYHLNRRIEDAYGLTDKAKHTQDSAIYPSYIKRHPSMSHSAVRREVLGCSSPREVAASPIGPHHQVNPGHQPSLEHTYFHAPQAEYNRVDEYVAGLAAATAPARPTSAPAVRPTRPQSRHPAGPPLATCRSTVFSDRPSAYSSSRYNHDGGDGYQGLSISGNLLDSFPGGTHRSRAGAVGSHGGGHAVQPPRGDRYTPRRGDQYFHSGKFHTMGEHSVYKRAIMAEITECRLYKERDLQALFRAYISRAPISDKDTVEAVVMELKLELDVL
ncbi:MAG: hypothetical protein WDW36_000852 [Sanguina aurantia]